MSAVYFWASAEGNAFWRLRELLDAEIADGSVCILSSLTALADEFRWDCPDRPVLILLAQDRQDLNAIQSFGSWLTDTRMVLILPDHDTDTVRRGHSLRPRYVGYADGGFADIVAVLRQMTGKMAGGKEGGRTV